MNRYWWIVFSLFSACLSSCHRPLGISFVQVEDVQLSPPSVRVSQVFFHNTTTVYLSQPPADCQIYYTDNKQPPTEHSLKAGDSIQVNTTAILRFKTIGGSYLASEEVSVDLFRLGARAIDIDASTDPKPPYDQAAATILIDQRKGSTNFRDRQWLGYQAPHLSFELELDGTVISGLTLSVLEDQNSWIFAPDSLRVQFLDEAGKLLAAGQTSYDTGRSKKHSAFQFMSIEVDEIRPARARLFIYNLPNIPDWHPGSGHAPWLFIDEILLR